VRCPPPPHSSPRVHPSTLARYEGTLLGSSERVHAPPTPYEGTLLGSSERVHAPPTPYEGTLLGSSERVHAPPTPYEGTLLGSSEGCMPPLHPMQVLYWVARKRCSAPLPSLRPLASTISPLGLSYCFQWCYLHTYSKARSAPLHSAISPPLTFCHLTIVSFVIQVLNGMNSYGCDGMVRVFRQKSTLEDAIGSHACSLEANMRVTNSIPLGWPLLLPVHTENSV
jgi:hypothetical protein